MWIINGITMRVAQSIGMHHEPSRLGLSPFDAEIRRRLWWHIVTGVLCHYPSTSRGVPRKEKTAIPDFATRLAQLERTIVAISSTDMSVTPKPENRNVKSLRPGLLSQIENEIDIGTLDDLELGSLEKTPGMLVHQSAGYSGHYVNEVFLSRALEEMITLLST